MRTRGVHKEMKTRSINKRSLLRHFMMPAASLLLLTACGGLSKQEKRMVGNYYIADISDSRPLIELHADGTSVMRAIRPGELSFFVTGQWKVDNDSLIIVNDPSSISIEEGDPAFIGEVTPRVAYPIEHFDDATLRITKQGIVYDYHRRAE